MDNQQPNTTPPSVTPSTTSTPGVTSAPTAPPAAPPSSSTPSILTSETPKEPSQPSYMIFIGVGVLMVIAIIAGLFFMGLKQSEKVSQPPQPTQAVIASPSPEAMKPEPALSSSDEIDSLEKDVEGTDLSGVDKELDEISKEATGL